MELPSFTEFVDWRVTFRDAETDGRISVRVAAGDLNTAVNMASRMVDEGAVGQGRKWLSFDSCESLPDREWAANSGRLGLLQRALQRQSTTLQGHRGNSLAAARRVAANIIDRGV